MPNSSAQQAARIAANGARNGRAWREGHELVEASLERAEAYERLGDFERALEWLNRAAALNDGLPTAYQAKRARWARAAACRPRPASGDWRNPLAEPGRDVPAP